MNFIKTITLLVLPFVLLGCASNNITTDYSEFYDFSNLKRFTLQANNPDDKIVLDYLGGNIFDQRARDDIASNLTLKGMIQSVNNPDFSVGYRVRTSDKIHISSVDSEPRYSYGLGYYNGGFGWSAASTQTTVSNDKQLHFTIVINDAKTHKRIWQGSTESVLSSNATPDERRLKLKKAIDGILQTFPPFTLNTSK